MVQLVVLEVPIHMEPQVELEKMTVTVPPAALVDLTPTALVTQAQTLTALLAGLVVITL